jgi:DNA-binding Lrp family transcriptional regulator
MSVLHQKIRGDDDPAITRGHDCGIITRPEKNVPTAGQARGDRVDQPELTEGTDAASHRRRQCLPLNHVPPADLRNYQPPRRRHTTEDEMTVQAYILVQTEVGKAAVVAQQIQSIAGVTLAEDVTGPYDVIVRAEAATVDELGKLVVARVQSVDGITRTLTCPVVHL